MKNRKGCVIIQEAFIYDKDADLDLLQLVFSQFVPINVEIIDFPTKQRIFYGYSKHFDEVAEGIMPPFYDILVNQVGQSKVIDFKKK